MGRMVAGFLVAPAIPLAAYLIATSKYADETFVAGGLIIFYGLAAVGGIPMFLLLRHRNWLKWWQISLIGLLLPMPIAIDWVMNPPCCESTAFRIFEGAFFLLMGFVTALSFWLIALWRSPAARVHEKAINVA
jgi:hypothetical protein